MAAGRHSPAQPAVWSASQMLSCLDLAVSIAVHSKLAGPMVDLRQRLYKIKDEMAKIESECGGLSWLGQRAWHACAAFAEPELPESFQLFSQARHSAASPDLINHRGGQVARPHPAASERQRARLPAGLSAGASSCPRLRPLARRCAVAVVAAASLDGRAPRPPRTVSSPVAATGRRAPCPPPSLPRAPALE